MGRRTRGDVAAAVLAVLVVAALAPAVTAAPSLGVTVDRTPVQDGETITVTDDPLLGMEISADATIESVEIRVDGESRHTFDPGSSSFSDSVTLDLDDGEHEVTVTASASGTTERTVTVRKDSDGPRVSYTSPFTTDVGRPGSSVQIETAKTTLAGDLRDLSGVQMVRIERHYEWKFAGQSERSRQTYRIEDPGENFSQPILFGLGDNDLKVELIDVHGQRTTHDITVTVVDDQKPSITLDRFERDGQTLHIEGVVDDNVKVRSLDIRTPSGRKSVLTETSKEPTEERISASFEVPARVGDNTEEITLIATDVAGNTRRWTVPLDYRGHIVPTVSIDADATAFDGDAVAVSGLVADGRVSQVVVETVGPDGAVVASTTVHEGEVTDRVSIRSRLQRADGATTVVVRAVDADGREHQESLTLEAASATTAQSESTPAATTAAPSTAVPTTAAAVTADVRPEATGPRAALLDPGVPRLPVPVALPLAVPLPVPFAGTGLVVALLALVMGLSALGDRGDEGAASATAAAGEDRPADAARKTTGDRGADPAVGSGEAGGRRGEQATTGERAQGRQSADQPRDTPGGERARDHGRSSDAPGDGTADRGPAAGGGPAAEPSSPGASERTPEPENEAESESGAKPEPASSFDVTEHLGVSSLAEVDEADVASLVDALDDDDTESVVAAIRALEAVGVERPALLAATDAEAELRDLRLAPDPVVSDAASRAVRRLTDD
jgi:hypothetical protein